MKTFLLKISLLSLSFLLFGNLYAQNNFTLKGKISNWDKPAKIFIEYTNNGEHIIDSVYLSNGSFEYQGKIDTSTMAILGLSPDGSSFDQSSYPYKSSLILNPGVTEINGDDLETATKNWTHTSTKITNLTTVEDGEKAASIKYPRFFGGVTFSRIDWGFSRLMDDGKFSLSGSKNDLAYKKASNFGFDVLQFGVRFSDNFKTYLSAGVEWNYLRLKNNILLHEKESPLSYEFVDEDDVRYTKNVFTTTYLRMPVSFEWRSNKLSSGERVKVAFGSMTGVLLKGTQRLNSDKHGKQKFKDNYSLATFQYGPFIRIGYDDFGIFAKYYMNDMFENSPDMKGLNNFTFGLTLGF